MSGSELVPPTYDEYPLLYAVRIRSHYSNCLSSSTVTCANSASCPQKMQEMFAYSMAAADLNLKHNLVKDLFTGCMTHWPHTKGEYTNAVEASAKQYANLIGSSPERTDGSDKGASSCFLPPLNPPPFLHYCARYSFETPYPPQDGTPKLYHFFAKRRVDHDILDDCNNNNGTLAPFISNKLEKIEGGHKDWNVLAICAIVRSINFAKTKGCGI